MVGLSGGRWEMTYFPDGPRYCYLKNSEEGEGINVGWLAAEHAFQTGACREGSSRG